MSQYDRVKQFFFGSYGFSSSSSPAKFQYRRLKYLALLVQALLAFMGVGCMSDAYFYQPTRPVFKVVVNWSDASQICTVDVTVDQPGEDLDLDVEVEAEAGIIFTDTGSSLSSRDRLQMFAEDSRTLSYPCRFDTTPITRPGAYMVRAKAYKGTSTIAYFSAATKLYVYVSEFTTATSYILSEQAFMDKYQGSFKAGTRNLDYQVVLDSDQNPQSGNLYVLVKSPRDHYAPYLKIDANGGIEFIPAHGLTAIDAATLGNALGVQMKPIAAEGSRVLVVPFQLLDGSHDGAYSIRVSEQDGDEVLIESAPFRLQIASVPEDPDQKWLAVDATFVPTQQPRVERGSVKAQPDQSQPTPETPVESPQTLLPQEPSPVPTDVIPETGTGSKVAWDMVLRGYSGNRWQAYEKFVSGKAPISWEEFKILALVHNPQLVQDDYTFRQDKNYFLPRVVQDSP